MPSGQPHEHAQLGRRRVLAIAGGAVGAGLLPHSAAVDAAAGSASLRAVSMAMHIHGSFSEGIASMHAHLAQARRLGVDVIWWTDHDFRQYAFGYRRAFRFDRRTERENGHPLTWDELPALGGMGGRHFFVDDVHSPHEDGGSLFLRGDAAAGDAWGTYLLQGNAWNFTYSTSYLDTVLTLDVRPGQAGPDGQVVVEVGSSYRPATAGRPAGIYRLQYRVGAPAGRSTEEDGLLGVIGVPVRRVGRWQRLRMDLQSDHDALWPDTVRGDAALKVLRIGVRGRRGIRATGYVDRLRFLRGRRTPADGHAALAAIARDYRTRYPDIRTYAAAEVSLVNHVSSFGGDGTLPTYPEDSLVKDETEASQRKMVRFLHRHRAVVCLNHPEPDALAERLLRTRANGCDLIEVGRGNVEARLPSYDVAARNAIFLTATGVSDDHDGEDWLSTDQARWVTSVWSASKSRADLCAALVAGRAWFFDPLFWRGRIDLLLGGRAPMGGVLFTRSSRLALTVRVTGLPRDSRLEVVIGRCDRPGLADAEPRTRTVVVPAGQVEGGQWATRITRSDGVYARVEVRRDNGTIVGASNPVWALPERLRGEIDVPRPRVVG